MTDQRIADIGRDLAVALKTLAHDRDPDSAKRVRELQTRLVRACEEEQQEEVLKPSETD